MARFVIGDIHGHHKALLQVLEKSKFDYEKDKLIALGDVCDGWPFVWECVEELMKIKNLIYILGNHDRWAFEWTTCGIVTPLWTDQGGKATIKSYQDHGGQMPQSHIDFFNHAILKYVEDNKLFVHGGIDVNVPLDQQPADILLWDRFLIKQAKAYGHNRPNYKLTEFDEIFIGHTPTLLFDTIDPIHFCEVMDCDTGAGWTGGRLTLMDIDTHEFWQSDFVETFYPDIKGRGQD